MKNNTLTVYPDELINHMMGEFNYPYDLAIECLDLSDDEEIDLHSIEAGL